MVREILTLSVGQCGVQLGHKVWRQYCAEHGINKLGKQQDVDKNDMGEDYDGAFQCFFDESHSGQFVPRNLSVDLEPNVIDDVRNSEYGGIFNEDFLINGKEDAANNFARGHYTVGRDIMDRINDRLRKLLDHCDNLQGFIMNHSVGGGTGSGLASLILERLAIDYRKKSKIGFEVFPCDTISTSVVEPYNSLLTTHWLLDHTEVSVLLDNEAIYEIVRKKLGIKKPSYCNLNKLIAKNISSVTASLRFTGELNVDIVELQTNLVPFPRLHFMNTSMAPIVNAANKDSYDGKANDVKSITDQCVQPDSFFIKMADFDSEEDKYMTVMLNYRGGVSAKEAAATVSWLKNSNKLSFVEWVPTPFKVGLNDVPCSLVEGDDLAYLPKNVSMIANNTATSRIFTDRISKRFDMMYSQRAYVHWFVGEGMEEGEFVEAREDLGFLEKDYLDVLSDGGVTDSYEESDVDEDEDN